MATAEVKARISLESSAFDRGINKVMAGVKRLGPIALSATKHVAALGAAAASAFAVAAAIGVKQVYDLGSQLDEMSAQTGIAVGELQKLRAVFKAAGMGEDEVGMVVNRMQKFIAANKELQGISPEKQFLAIVQAIQAIQDPAERAKKAMEIFGRSGGRILAVNAEDFTDAAGFLGRAGQIMQDNVKDFDRASDLLGRAPQKLGQFWTGFASKITDSILPILEKIDKMDFASMGEQLAADLSTIASVIVGAFSEGKISEIIGLSIKVGLLNARDAFVVSMMNGITAITKFLTEQLEKAAPPWLRTITKSAATFVAGKATGTNPANLSAAARTAAEAAIKAATGGEASEASQQLDRLLAEMSRTGERIFEEATRRDGTIGAASEIPGANLDNLGGKNAQMPVSALRRIGGGMFGGNFGGVKTVQDNILNEAREQTKLLRQIATGRNRFALADNY